MENTLEFVELGFDLPLLQSSGLVDELVQTRDLGPQGCRVNRGYDVFELVDDLLLLVLWQLIEVVRELLLDLLLPVGFRVIEDLLTLVPHPLQTSPHRVDGRGHPALQHGHGEADGPPSGTVLARGP